MLSAFSLLSPAGFLTRLAKVATAYEKALSAHHVARTTVAEERNQLAGDAYEISQQFRAMIRELEA